MARPGYYFALIFTLFILASAELRADTLLVLGNSISAGYGISSNQAWPNLLQQRLQQIGDWQVVNASISGETTQGGRLRLPALLKLLKPDWVVLELGGNDGLRGYPLRRIADNLAAMIKQSQVAGAQVMLLGMRIPPNYGDRYTEPFFQQYQTLAATYNTALEPFLLEGLATDPNMMQEDGMHPRAIAQPLILERVWQVLEPMLISTEQIQPSASARTLP